MKERTIAALRETHDSHSENGTQAKNTKKTPGFRTIFQGVEVGYVLRSGM